MISLEEQKLLRQRHNPDGSLLRRQQLRMLEMLKYVDDICKKHNIKYWLSSGTLLGAVRHGGFIPWDDDLDIEMLRDDYDKLIRVLAEEISDKYVVHSHKNDKHYFLPFIKIRDLKSELLESEIKGHDYVYKGIFIDVFPMERNVETLMKISDFLMRILNKVSCFKLKSDKIRDFLLTFIFFIINNIIFPILRIFIPIFSSKKYLYHTLGVPFFKKREINDIFPLSSINFEDYTFPSPKDVNGYLSKLYGNNYMKIPEDNEKLACHTYKLEFFD